MELKNLIAKLHPLERKVLTALKKETGLSGIIKATGLQEVEVIRALQWLENKDVLKLESKTEQVIILGNNGQKYLREGLPEKRFLLNLTEQFQDVTSIIKKAKLGEEEMRACIGLLKQKKAIELRKEKELQVKILPEGKKIIKEGIPEENFLHQHFPLNIVNLSADKKPIYEQLMRRADIICSQQQKSITFQLKELGKQLVKQDFSGEVINRLTPEMLKTGSWKKKQFRAYDVEINVPAIYGGKKHFVTQAAEYAKNIWIEMGFKEMSGALVQTSFWNFDALFTAQDHPVRELQDTFYLGGNAEKGSLPDKQIVQKVKESHETGGKTGSTGWQYPWNPEEAKKNVLRTHTTVLSAQTLAGLKEKDLPAKFFALGKCFRNEALDWNHLFEFNQTEGIVVDENANFCHLLGYLKEFFKKMGFPQARFRPAYFPYTEPSVEIDVWHSLHKKWMELGGAGMFRPEVVIPLLGKDIPVLAWGPGFDRIILDYYEITDIRDLYKNDLKQLREIKMWMK